MSRILLITFPSKYYVLSLFNTHVRNKKFNQFLHLEFLIKMLILITLPFRQKIGVQSAPLSYSQLYVWRCPKRELLSHVFFSKLYWRPQAFLCSMYLTRIFSEEICLSFPFFNISLDRRKSNLLVLEAIL